MVTVKIDEKIKGSPCGLLGIGCLGLLILYLSWIIIFTMIYIPLRSKSINAQMIEVFAEIQCDTPESKILDMFESVQEDGYSWRKDYIEDGLYELCLVSPLQSGDSNNSWVLHVRIATDKVEAMRFRLLNDRSQRPPDAPMDVICQE